MRAFAIPEFNGTGAVAERPMPEPAEGQLLVRVHAAGVNPMDPFVVAGYMASMVEHRLPIVPGFDYSGEITAVGPGVVGHAVGDEVYGAIGKPTFGEGTWAEYATVSAALANKRPGGLDATDAGALATAGGEAIALVDTVDPKRGDTILVVGASGGVGSFVIQLAKRAGARVIAATRPANADYARELGADEVVDSSGDVVAQVRALAPDGVAAIIDTYHDVDGLKALAAAVRPNGWIVSPRAQGAEDAFADVPIQAALVSAALGRVGELGELLARGEVRIQVVAVPLEEAGRALQAISSAGVRGKLAIAVD